MVARNRYYLCAAAVAAVAAFALRPGAGTPEPPPAPARYAGPAVEARELRQRCRPLGQAVVVRGAAIEVHLGRVTLPYLCLNTAEVGLEPGLICSFGDERQLRAVTTLSQVVIRGTYAADGRLDGCELLDCWEPHREGGR
jgi:hypothetical protein